MRLVVIGAAMAASCSRPGPVQPAPAADEHESTGSTAEPPARATPTHPRRQPAEEMPRRLRNTALAMPARLLLFGGEPVQPTRAEPVRPAPSSARSTVSPDVPAADDAGRQEMKDLMRGLETAAEVERAMKRAAAEAAREVTGGDD